MIDNIKEVEALIIKMKEELPIPAHPTKRLLKFMVNSEKLKLASLLEIEEIFYMGDEGGIGCAISFDSAVKAVIVSITHLRIKDKHPLEKEIKQYQSNRIRALKKGAY